MRRYRSTILPILALSAMLCIILDSKTSLQAASAAIDLCIKSVIPSLFPLLILSSMLTSSLVGIRFPLLRPIGKICKIPEGTESAFLSGILGGYPLGAKTVSELYENGSLSKKSAERMISFCNNAGPSFIFGICSTLFQSSYTPWLLWLIQILSAMLTGILLPGHAENLKHRKHASNNIKNISSGIKSMSLICGWVILFRVLIEFLRTWVLWILPDSCMVITEGMLELTNGCLDLNMIESEHIRLIICSGFLSFGGICITMQTRSVAPNLSIKKYIFGKVLQSSISIALALLFFLSQIQPQVFIFITILLIAAGIFYGYFRKRVAFSNMVMYNEQK